MLTQPAAGVQKFRIDKTSTGEITLLTLHGVIDEGFEGRKIAESIRTSKIVLDLREVRRFASWGMAEWTDFVRLSAARDIYIVEASTHALSQFNLVSGLLGHAKLVSFCVPYRCGHCGEESESVMVVPIDRAAVRNLADHEQLCTTCNSTARVERYLASMCTTMADRPAFDIDDVVVAFLRTQFNYAITPDLGRFRAYRRANKQYTYLRLSGDVGGLPSDVLAKASQATTVIDLQAVQAMDANGVARWRKYVEATLPAVTSLQLLDCPPGFLEQAIRSEDLPALKVRTFALPYWCATCNRNTLSTIDVASNLEHLVEGLLPTARCSSCKAELEAAVSPTVGAVVRRLPVRVHDAVLDRFLDKARSEPADALENALVVRPEKPAKPSGGVPRALYVAIGLLLVAAAGIGVLGLTLWKDRGRTQTVVRDDPKIVPPTPAPAFQRPDWIISDLPSSAFCHDLVNRLMCVGVSSYRPTRGEAVVDANDAALDELVNALGLKIGEPFFKTSVVPAYSATRAKALARLQAADVDRAGADYAAANAVVRAARKRVVETFQASGGPAVPAQRSDWYWEEYKIENGKGTEVLVFVRYDVSLDALKALVDGYSATSTIQGTTVMTAFPGLAWADPEFKGGAVVTKVGKSLADAGVSASHLITAANDQRIVDAGGLEKHAGAASGPVKLTVKSTTGRVSVIELTR